MNFQIPAAAQLQQHWHDYHRRLNNGNNTDKTQLWHEQREKIESAWGDLGREVLSPRVWDMTAMFNRLWLSRQKSNLQHGGAIFTKLGKQRTEMNVENVAYLTGKEGDIIIDRKRQVPNYRGVPEHVPLTKQRRYHKAVKPEHRTNTSEIDSLITTLSDDFGDWDKQHPLASESRHFGMSVLVFTGNIIIPSITTEIEREGLATRFEDTRYRWKNALEDKMLLRWAFWKVIGAVPKPTTAQRRKDIRQEYPTIGAKHTTWIHTKVWLRILAECLATITRKPRGWVRKGLRWLTFFVIELGGTLHPSGARLVVRIMQNTRRWWRKSIKSFRAGATFRPRVKRLKHGAGSTSSHGWLISAGDIRVPSV